MSRCSFCREVGHNITRCNAPELQIIWNSVLSIVADYSCIEEEIERVSNHVASEIIRYLKRSFDYNLIKAVAVKYCKVRMYDTEPTVILKIYTTVSNIFVTDMRELFLEVSAERPASAHWIVEPLLLCLETQEELHKEVFCAICLETYKKIETVTTNCNHEFCKTCLCGHLDYHKSDKTPACPMCRTEIKTVEIKDVDYYNEMYDRYVTQPKDYRPDVRIQPLILEFDDEHIAFLDSFDFLPETM